MTALDTQTQLLAMMAEQNELLRSQLKTQGDQMLELMTTFKQSQSQKQQVVTPITNMTPKFTPFDPTTELWTEYWARFKTFIPAHSVPSDKEAQVFLTNQSKDIYKVISNQAAKENPPIETSTLTLTKIEEFMKVQFDPKRFIVRERFKFWSNMKRKPGEHVNELAARIRQKAATCDFMKIKDPLDEALRTNFMCSVNNEAVLKALFKIKDDDLSFTKAIQVAAEVEDAAKYAKEIVYGPSQTTSVNKLQHTKTKPEVKKTQRTCYRCGSKQHLANVCRHKATTCNFYKKTGHLETVCQQKKKSTTMTKIIINSVNQVTMQQIYSDVYIGDKMYKFEIDTGAGDNFTCKEVWADLSKPQLSKLDAKYLSASGHNLPVLGMFSTLVKNSSNQSEMIRFVVSEMPGLNLLGREAICKLGISVDALMAMDNKPLDHPVHTIHSPDSHPDESLQNACIQMCDEFSDLQYSNQS
ncbi:uncharacterized protein LOC117113351 [Anneissia japonica]|uniref:uncharacterized protein LOC117113351 n=1 Tax=Anneissia japonica TaxID=1529436 RepID=UPI001425A05C|nr:uncharacterized protein LOC117113351 [Anneissia japonica]